MVARRLCENAGPVDHAAALGVFGGEAQLRQPGETAPLYFPDLTETQKAANRRVEIRLVPYRG